MKLYSHMALYILFALIFASCATISPVPVTSASAIPSETAQPTQTATSTPTLTPTIAPTATEAGPKAGDQITENGITYTYTVIRGVDGHIEFGGFVNPLITKMPDYDFFFSGPMAGKGAIPRLF